MSGGLLVAGTGSDAGKSVVAAGICRWLSRRGVRVAPFKAQNMALNSAVTPGGAEIGRAQAAQAQAAGVEPEAAMNPILIKPSGERLSQLLLMGRPLTDVDARSYQELLRGRNDIEVVEEFVSRVRTVPATSAERKLLGRALAAAARAEADA